MKTIPPRVVPLVTLILMFFAASSIAAEREEDSFLRDYGATFRFRLGEPTGVNILPDGSAVLFLRSGPRSFVNDLYEFSVATGEERKLLSAGDLLGGRDENLTPEELARRERMRMAARGIAGYSLSKDGAKLLVPLSGRLFVVDRASGKTTELPTGKGSPVDPRFSPDGESVAYVSGGELFVIGLGDKAPRQLTTGATETIEHGLAEFVAQEEMDRMHGFWWSPDSSRLVYQRTDTSDVERLHILDPIRPEDGSQSWPYPRPGKNNAEVTLGITDAAGGETTWVEWDRQEFPYVARVDWSENAPLTVLVQNRTQTRQLLLEVDPVTGKTSQLLEETDPAWINLDGDMPHWLDSGEAFLWSTERQGAWQLELRQRDGSLAAVLTPPELGYRSFIGFTDNQTAAYVSASADPVSQAVYRVSLDPKRLGVKPVTDTTQGLHFLREAKKAKTQIRGQNSLEGRKPIEVVRADGTVAGTLKSVAETPPWHAKVEMISVGDEPRLHAAVVRPHDMEPGRKYPVIVQVYGGPHSQTVMADRDRYLLHQWFANRGFIVVSIDGRGTPSRGREWERAIKGNVIAPPMDDQVRGLMALGKKYPEMDLENVGIYGWSFGGYFSAMAVLQRPDVFKVGVAGAPVIDWRDYDTHYTERYMGMPDENKAGYEAASALTYAANLQRPLMLIHGTADDNVYFIHSIKMADALFKAGKPYDFLPLTGFTHMVPDPLVTERLYTRIAEYMEEHLTERKREEQ
jgi:dipeptidyl-peptidase 4